MDSCVGEKQIREKCTESKASYSLFLIYLCSAFCHDCMPLQYESMIHESYFYINGGLKVAKETCMSPIMGNAWVPIASVTCSREGWYVKVIFVIYCTYCSSMCILRVLHSPTRGLSSLPPSSDAMHVHYVKVPLLNPWPLIAPSKKQPN